MDFCIRINQISVATFIYYGPPLRQPDVQASRRGMFGHVLLRWQRPLSLQISNEAWGTPQSRARCLMFALCALTSLCMPEDSNWSMQTNLVIALPRRPVSSKIASVALIGEKSMRAAEFRP
jgi:hypothetical protein